MIFFINSIRRPERVLQQCCQQDAQQLMCNRENEINQTKRYKCHQHTGQAEFLRKTQLQIVDIEADNGHDKKYFSRNWKSVGKKYIKQHCSQWVNISYFKEGLNGTPKGVPAVA